MELRMTGWKSKILGLILVKSAYLAAQLLMAEPISPPLQAESEQRRYQLRSMVQRQAQRPRRYCVLSLTATSTQRQQSILVRCRSWWRIWTTELVRPAPAFV